MGTRKSNFERGDPHLRTGAPEERERMKHLHLVSGGVGSWLAAKIDIRDHPDVEHLFSFTDVLYEDADCYRFLVEGVANLLGRDLGWSVPAAEDFPDYRVSEDVPIEEYHGNDEWRAFLAQLRQRTVKSIPELDWLVEGRDPWEIYRDERFLGNSSVDPCSKIAKRQIRDRWLKENHAPDDVTITIGIGPDEKHRFEGEDGSGFRPRMAANGWVAIAPLIGAFEGEVGAFGYLKAAGLKRPRLYSAGYIHNNCGGFCCKAGKAHWQNRFRVQPERFAYDAMMERKLRAFLGADVSMLADRYGDTKRPLTLDAFADRLRSAPQMEFAYDQGDSGCGCMLDEAAA